MNGSHVLAFFIGLVVANACWFGCWLFAALMLRKEPRHDDGHCSGYNAPEEER